MATNTLGKGSAPAPCGGSAARNAIARGGLLTKDALIKFRISAADKATAEALASKAGQRLSDYARTRTLAGRAPAKKVVQVEAMAPELFAELSAIGNNINQIARALNRGRDPGTAHLAEQLAELFRVMMADEVTARRMRAAEDRTRAPNARPE